MTGTTTTNKLRDFIVHELRWDGPREELTDEYPLLASGVIDSLGLFRIVAYIESEYGIEIDDADLVPSNFGTLAAMSKLVERSS